VIAVSHSAHFQSPLTISRGGKSLLGPSFDSSNAILIFLVKKATLLTLIALLIGTFNFNDKLKRKDFT